jgi:hypothetical protein
MEPGREDWGFRPDAAVSLDDGRFAVVYQRLGTRGLLLRDGKPLRVLPRSTYRASNYEYPVCLWRVPDGRVLLAHCPEHYNRIELEDAESGYCFTASTVREPKDFFHSRLAASPSGTRLLSAGWVWHPWDCVVHFDVLAALRDPRQLDRLDGTPDGFNVCLAEQSSACWLSDERVVISSPDERIEPEELEEWGEDLYLQPRGLGVYDVARKQYLHSVVLDRVAGTMMRVDERHVIAFHEHPRLIQVETGVTVHEWPELRTGRQSSSILQASTAPPPIAMDPVRRRFAVAGPQTITVVQLAGGVP